MEHDLGGADNVQSPVVIHIGVGAEGLHHGLLVGFGPVHLVHHHVAVRQHPVHISHLIPGGGTEISFVVRSHRTESLPVFLRMYQNLPVQGFVGIQNRLQHLIGYFDQLHGLLHTSLIPSGHNGHRVSHIPEPPVQDQPVIGAGFRIGLPRQGKPLLGNVPISEDCLDARHQKRLVHGNILNESVGMGASQQFYHQTIPGRNIIHINRLPRHQSHGVAFDHRLIYISHTFASLPLSSFWALYFINSFTARICPSYPEQRQRFPARYSRIS